MFVKVILFITMTIRLQTEGTYAAKSNMHYSSDISFGLAILSKGDSLPGFSQEEHLPCSVHHNRLDVKNRMTTYYSRMSRELAFVRALAK